MENHGSNLWVAPLPGYVSNHVSCPGTSFSADIRGHPGTAVRRPLIKLEFDTLRGQIRTNVENACEIGQGACSAATSNSNLAVERDYR
jgi:hypothetical protein